ncbi:MAG: hypothetical protein K2X03_01040 [Bryobacteraceae bacterium]|nr:hypothetical protein [Bryobacteraceae bacterium]
MLRWTEPDSMVGCWREPALILSTLILNFGFWISYERPGSDFVFAFAGLPLTALFFVGPACAARSVGLWQAVDDSLGFAGGCVVRLCAAWFLSIWIAELLAGANWLLRGTFSPWIALPLIAFVMITGLGSQRTTARLAAFSNRLGWAIVIAALVRAREGWPAIGSGLPGWADLSDGPNLFGGLSRLSFILAPLLFLAADGASRLERRKDVLRAGFFGMVLPFFLLLTLMAVISDAWLHAPFRRKVFSIIVGALWGSASQQALAGPMMLAAVTLLGAMRFGVRSFSGLVPGRWWTWLGLPAAALGWLVVGHYRPEFRWPVEIPATGLVLTAAVQSAGGVRRPVAFISLAAGVVVSSAIYLRTADAWSFLWILPGYATTFAVCLLGRLRPFR